MPITATDYSTIGLQNHTGTTTETSKELGQSDFLALLQHNSLTKIH